MTLRDDIRYINERLKVLLEKVNPTAEELLLALYNAPNYEEDL